MNVMASAVCDAAHHSLDKVPARESEPGPASPSAV